MGKGHTLKTALEKILPLCGYPKIYKLGEPYEMEGDINLRITADWIIEPMPGPVDKEQKALVINLLDELTPKTPPGIRGFLSSLGIKIVDYPPGDETMEEFPEEAEILDTAHSKTSLIEGLLDLAGQGFSRDLDIPVYRGRQDSFNLVMKADFYLNNNGKDCIIDLMGLGPDVVSLLKEHEFLVLSLAKDNDPSSMVSRTLDFIGVQRDSKPHHFMATERDEARNIRLTIPGIIFQDQNGRTILASHSKIPKEIASFLYQKGYRILRLALS
jgi:hypothetical protein